MFEITCTFSWIIQNKMYKLTYRKYFFGIYYSTWEDIWDLE